MALSYTFPLSPFPLIHSSFNFPFMIFLAPVSEMSPPQSDPEFYSVTYRAAGAQAGRRMGKNVVVIQRGWSSERRNKTTFLPLSVATLTLEKPSLSAECRPAPEPEFTHHPQSIRAGGCSDTVLRRQSLRPLLCQQCRCRYIGFLVSLCYGLC